MLNLRFVKNPVDIRHKTQPIQTQTMIAFGIWCSSFWVFESILEFSESSGLDSSQNPMLFANNCFVNKLQFTKLSLSHLFDSEFIPPTNQPSSLPGHGETGQRFRGCGS